LTAPKAPSLFVSSEGEFTAIFSVSLDFLFGTFSCGKDKRKYYKSSQDLLTLDCSLSFVHPNESEPKEKGALRKWSAVGGSSRSLLKKAILIFGDLLKTQEIPKIALVVVSEFCVRGTGLHFRKGLFSPCKMSRSSSN